MTTALWFSAARFRYRPAALSTGHRRVEGAKPAIRTTGDANRGRHFGAGLCSVPALLAARRHVRTGTSGWRRLWAMLTGIAVERHRQQLLAAGEQEWIRWLFVIYLLATVADCCLRASL